MLDAVTVVDAHVHVHPGTDARALLDSAARNLAAVATEIGAQTWQGVLMLAEMRGADWFGATRRGAPQTPGWSIEPVADDAASLSATRPGVELTIIAGRQIVTAEGIEVLALATTAEYRRWYESCDHDFRRSRTWRAGGSSLGRRQVARFARSAGRRGGRRRCATRVRGRQWRAAVVLARARGVRGCTGAKGGPFSPARIRFRCPGKSGAWVLSGSGCMSL